MWLARTCDGVTHATEKPGDRILCWENRCEMTVTACNLAVYRDGTEPRLRRPSEAQPYIGLFRGLGSEVTCRACRENADQWIDDGLNERGEEIAA